MDIEAVPKSQSETRPSGGGREVHDVSIRVRLFGPEDGDRDLDLLDAFENPPIRAGAHVNAGFDLRGASQSEARGLGRGTEAVVTVVTEGLGHKVAEGRFFPKTLVHGRRGLEKIAPTTGGVSLVCHGCGKRRRVEVLIRRTDDGVDEEQSFKTIRLKGGGFDHGVAPHRMSHADHGLEIQIFDDFREVLPENFPVRNQGGVAFSVPSLIEAESPPRAEMTKRLVPHASMKSGGVGKEKRCPRVSQLGVPFVAGQL